jgi:hypothetical protein
LIALEGAEDALIGVCRNSRHCQREVAVERVIQESTANRPNGLRRPMAISSRLA